MSATSTLAMTQFVTLADNFDKDKVTPGVLGFIVFAVIGGAVWLLMKSMNKHMKKVDFQEKGAPGEDGPAGPATADRSEATAERPASPKAAPAKGARPKTS